MIPIKINENVSDKIALQNVHFCANRYHFEGFVDITAISRISSLIAKETV